MHVDFTIELFGYIIEDSIDIPDTELNNIPKKDQYDFIYDYINNEIKNTMELYVEDTTRDDE